MNIQTPIGPLKVPAGTHNALVAMSDRQVADEAFKGQHTEPFAFQVLIDRGLCFRGDMRSDVYQRIAEREAAAA